MLHPSSFSSDNPGIEFRSHSVRTNSRPHSVELLLIALLLVLGCSFESVAASEKKDQSASLSRMPLDSAIGHKGLDGKIVYVDFWASWCVPCKLSFPWMVELAKKYDTAQFAIVTVNLDEDRVSGEKFFQRHEGRLEVIYDSKGSLAERYHVEAMPTSMLFDSNGKMVMTHRGFRESDKQMLNSVVDSLVKLRSRGSK